MDKSTDKQPLTPELEARVQRAVDNFMQGYGCCQSVVAAFADLYNLDDTMAKRIAAGFGGGVGRMRMMCGAVSGIVILAGLDRGQIDGADRKGKSMCYKVARATEPFFVSYLSSPISTGSESISATRGAAAVQSFAGGLPSVSKPGGRASPVRAS